jgi:carboxyl-terminal processing protease
MPANPTHLRRCAELLRTQLKAYIARSAYGKPAYYAALREQDAELKQAVQAMADGSANPMQKLSMK